VLAHWVFSFHESHNCNRSQNVFTLVPQPPLYNMFFVHESFFCMLTFAARLGKIAA